MGWRQSSVGQSLRAEENILGQTAAVSAPGRIMPVALRLATVDGLRLVRASNQRRLESGTHPAGLVEFRFIDYEVLRWSR